MEKLADSGAEIPASDVPAPEKPADDAEPSPGGGDKRARKKKPVKKKRNLWSVKITVVSLFLSAFISFLSELTSSAESIAVTILLLLFLIMASILFDGIGVAATSCDVRPFIAMASKKEYGAKTALWIVKNNEKVANVCNDVIGDIFGIISGACAAAIVIKITLSLDEKWQQWLSIGISSVVSAMTIGGKAFLKNIAINNSKEFVMFVSRILGIFDPEERRRKKKRDLKKKKFDAEKTSGGTASPKPTAVKPTVKKSNPSSSAPQTRDKALEKDVHTASESGSMLSTVVAEPSDGAKNAKGENSNPRKGIPDGASPTPPEASGEDDEA